MCCRLQRLLHREITRGLTDSLICKKQAGTPSKSRRPEPAARKRGRFLQYVGPAALSQSLFVNPHAKEKRHDETETYVKTKTENDLRRFHRNCALHDARAEETPEQSQARRSCPRRRDTVSTGPAVAGPDHGRADSRYAAEALGASASDPDATRASGRTAVDPSSTSTACAGNPPKLGPRSLKMAYQDLLPHTSVRLS